MDDELLDVLPGSNASRRAGGRSASSPTSRASSAVLSITGGNDVVDPRETRPTIIRALETAEGKRSDRPWKCHAVVPV